MRFAAIGLDHRHIYHMVGGLLEAGATCAGFDPETSDPRVLAGFRERFPDLPARRARRRLLDDPVDRPDRLRRRFPATAPRIAIARCAPARTSWSTSRA